jgi:hypothetical protein
MGLHVFRHRGDNVPPVLSLIKLYIVAYCSVLYDSQDKHSISLDLSLNWLLFSVY